MTGRAPRTRHLAAGVRLGASSVCAIALVMLALGATSRAVAPEPGPQEVTVDEHVRVAIPRDMTLEQRSLGPRGDMLIAADGG